ncbi:MAG: ferredoxin [Calditrichaeota bacterium]|nr:MAG: ferredoxin [Calditrichota bacterium]
MPDPAVDRQVDQVSSNGALDQSKKIDVQQVLRQFFLSGRKKDVQVEIQSLSGLNSIYKTRLLGVNKMRTDFPIIMPEKKSLHVVPLHQFIDDINSELSGDDEETAELKHYLLLIEGAIREKYFKKSADLKDGWKKAVKSVVSASRTEKSKKENLQKSLTSLFKKYGFSGELVGFHPEVIQRIFSRIYAKQTAKRAGDFLQNTKDLLQNITDILTSEFEKSDAAKTPGQLRSRLADDEFKLDTFSGMMAHIGDLSLSEKRIARLELVKEKLTQLVTTIESGEMAVSIELQTGLKHYEAELRKFIAYFRARQIAQLEIKNSYKPEKHDPFFEKFDLVNIPVHEQVFISPAIIYLKQDKLDAECLAEIARLAEADAPVKIIIEIEKPLEPGKSSYELMQISSSANRLLRTLLGENRAFVSQISISDLKGMKNGFKKGLQHNGPAIWGVFVGEKKNSVDRYVEVMSATHGRVSPVFTADPAKGSWAHKFCLKHNENFEQKWTQSATSFRNENEEVSEVTGLYTVFDYLSDQPEFDSHCIAVELSKLTDSFVPMDTFISEKCSADSIPYVVKYDKYGHEFAVVISQFLINVGQKLTQNWQALQELAGINNSHVLAQMSIEQEKLEKALQQKEADLEQAYQAKLDSALGSLADEIVGNIAAGLLGQAASPVSTPAPAAPATAPSETPSAESAKIAEPETTEEAEEDDAMSFDEAYIDTPLCTSCNECVQRNSMIFAYDGNKQAIIKDAAAGPFRDIVEAAEKCPVKIIHPGKPLHPDEDGLEDLIKRADVFN